MIVDFWPAYFRSLYGNTWPRTYCAIDCETTGYNFDRDVITEWGHCLVKDGEVVDRLSIVLNWTNHGIVADHWLRNRLISLASNMALGNKSCHMSYERMRKEGEHPDKTLAFIRDFTAKVAAAGIPFVLHNATFDENMIAANLVGFKVASAFSLGDNGYLDTEAIEKASQLLDHPRAHPRPNDTLRSYFIRVKNTRVTGVKSNLDSHCFHKYQFQDKYGIDPAHMHGAEIDAYCTHLLMKEFGERVSSEIKPLPMSLRPSAPASMTPPYRHSPLTQPTGLRRIRKQRIT